MKKIYSSLMLLLFLAPGYAQVTSTPIGTAGNVYTVLVGNVNSLAANDETGAVVFVHRNNPNVNGGTTADYRYDVSTNGGNTFTIDQGILNPNANTTTNASRYPNGVIHNPMGNTNPTSAYLGFYGSTVDVNTNVWNGHLSGVARLDNNPTTFTETLNTFNGGNTLIARSLVNGANGVFWAVDHGFDVNNQFTGEIIVSKGTWNAGTNDIDWAEDTIFDPTYDTFLNGNPQMATQSLNIAFSPNGMVGWVAFGTDMTNDGDAIFNPTFYHTNDGGATWEGPIIGALQDFPDIEAFTGGNGTNQLTTMAFDADLVVDANGVPHYVCVIGAGPDNAYSIFNPTAALHNAVYDITVDTGSTGSCQLNPQFLREVFTFRGTFGAAVQDNRPQASRTADGNKIFFGWLDSDPSNAPVNDNPNLWIRGMDIQNGTMTNNINFSGGDAVWDESVTFSLFAQESFTSGTSYTVPTVFTELTATDLDPVNFHYVQNVTFTDADFTLPIPMFTTSVSEALDPVCNGQAVGSISVLGSTSTLGSPVNTGAFSGISSNTNNTGGLVFSPPVDIIITGLKVPTTAGTTPQNLQVVTLLGMNPASTAPFTTVFYDTNIVDTGMVPVFIPVSATQSVGILGGRGGATLDIPEGGGSGLNANFGGAITQIQSFSFGGNISTGEAPSGSGFVGTGNIGDIEVQFVVNNVTYLWDDPMGQTTPIASGLTAGTYNVTITSGSGCSQTQTVTLNDPPLINVGSTAIDVLCNGDSTGTVDLNVTGGIPPFSYQWSNNTTTEDQLMLPTGTYTVSITDSIGCEIIETFTLNEPDTLSIPFVTITELDCWMDASGTILVTAAGGVGNYTYNWLPGGFNGENPTDLSSGIYVVTVTDGNGCTTQEQYFVDEPDPIGLTTFVTADYNGSSGTASVGITGNFPPFTILWNTTPPSPASIISGLSAGTYTVTVTDGNGCTNTADAIVDNVTGLGDLDDTEGQVVIFPNPAKDFVNIAIELDNFANVAVQVTDLMGKEISFLTARPIQKETLSIDLSQHPSGIYLVNVLLDDQRVVHKVTLSD